MLQKKIIEIENISVEELVAMISNSVLDGLESRLKHLQKEREQELLLTRIETAKYLHINMTTLWNWTKKGKIKAYGIGNRVYYKKNEIDKAIIRIN
ncbi:helix-turn-helix domain-containing protein [Flavobacterium psychraquaticum]|uniref:helix-turn-helix domain-containing protein n=1 Tax=Flavobacterium psychraquaticum TaxID=3103958 RepID=UPI002ACE12BB|nr:helix-turn-helix domain-containing protein [Flavobacterium sp. LB-N7T]